jgi:hypothetical protein
MMTIATITTSCVFAVVKQKNLKALLCFQLVSRPPCCTASDYWNAF